MRLALLLLLCLLVSPVVLAVVALQSEPAVRQAQTGVTADAVRAKRLLKRVARGLLTPAEQSVIVVTEGELNSVLGFAARSLPRTQTHVEAAANGLHAAISMGLPPTPLGQFYLNLRYSLIARAGAGEETAAQSRLSLGDIAVPGAIAAMVGAKVLDLGLGERLGTRFLDSIRAVSVEPPAIVVTVAPIKDLKSSLRLAAARARNMRDEIALLGDPETVGIYLAKLRSLDPGGRGSRSLARFTRPLFTLAMERSAGRRSVSENRAAILAMAMYFGNARLFEAMIGRVRTGALAGVGSRQGAAKLAGRNDLMLHFIISAGLKVASMSGISYTIGEVKELLDAARGGSGFSFADLAADRAGVRFAEVAVNSESAALLQRLLASGDEAAFFPDIVGLPEGLDERRFEATYGGLEGAAYTAMVREIDARIARCPAYR